MAKQKKKAPKDLATIKGNKGEWSEFYALLKILYDGEIYASDKLLNKRDDIFYNVINIIRTAYEQTIKYNRRPNIIEIEDGNGFKIDEIKIDSLNDYVKIVIEGIRRSGDNDADEETRAFKIAETSKIFRELHTAALCDDTKNKADIRITIYDPVTQYRPLLGFSIKSYLGGKPTLFNASKSSNIIYRITPDLSENEIIEVNRLGSYMKRIDWLINNGYSLSYCKMNEEIFRTNLELIDSSLPLILSELIKDRFITRKNKLVDLIPLLKSSNPCNYNLSVNDNFYDYKIRRLLVDSALGMKAKKKWTGIYNATGGFIVVKNDGELVCFHIYNWNEFQDYLMASTKIDLPDSGADRCDYGKLLNANNVGEDAGTYIKLNFQIRFT